MDKVVRIVLRSILAVMLLLGIGFLILWINSPGELKPLTDGQGQPIATAVVEKGRVEIGGMEQGFFVRGENVNNPVLLYLHGGPGSPELPFIIPNETTERLEKYFTVCYWEQRGAGMSYSKTLDPATVAVAHMVEDTRQMTEYLKERFEQEKIFLMGHSWGSYLGVKCVERHPELYRAFIGIGQITNQLLSEQLAYDHMMQLAVKAGDEKAIKDLRKFDKTADGFPENGYLIKVRTPLMNKYGIGIKHEGFVMSSLLKDILFFEGYKVAEKMSFAKGAMFSLEHIFPHTTNDNLFETSTVFQVPVYVVHGQHDYQVSYALAAEWMKMVEAPEKGFFTFEHSAHSPNLEEPEKFVHIIKAIAAKNRK